MVPAAANQRYSGDGQGIRGGGGPSQAFYREKIYLQLGFSSLEDYLVEAWEGRFLKLDANDILAMVNTWQRGDISDNPLYQVDIHQALGTIKAKAIITPSETDQYFPPVDSEIEARQMPNAELSHYSINMGASCRRSWTKSSRHPVYRQELEKLLTS